MPVASTQLVDYYATLQVHPDAESEVIEAAYRQLMKKYHPDVAGDDPAAVAEHHRRAKAINEAFQVLRDPDQRRFYDMMRIVVGTRPGPTASQTRAGRSAPTWSPADSPPPPPPIQPEAVDLSQVPDTAGWTQKGLVGALSAAYFLLPGPYEWEINRTYEWLTAVMVPLVGVLGFGLVTGRLTPLLGQAPYAGLLAWVLLALLSLPLLHTLPRVALAAGPSVLMFTAPGSSLLERTHLPIWLAWLGLSLLSLALSARLYLFSVLPTLFICWGLSRLT